MSRVAATITNLLALTLLGSCAASAPLANPSFPVSIESANERLRSLEGRRVKLDRPLVILGGFLDPGTGPYRYQKYMERYFEGRIIRITFADCFTFEACRAKLIETLERELGEEGAAQTTEVDVVAQSMGGLVAVFSSLPEYSGGKRLNVHRLFTISSPLSGAKLAMLTPFDVFGFQADMRPGSALYTRLARVKLPYPVYSYTRLDDTSVGEEYAALPGRRAWWVNNPAGERSHDGVFRDPRVLLDIVLRLRGETPVTTDPPAPLPATRP